MTAERSSEDNDGHQVRATIGLAGGCALQRRSVRHHERGFRKLGTEDVDALRSPVAMPAVPGFIRHQRD